MKQRGEAYHSISIYSITGCKLFDGKRKTHLGMI